jgi:D-sedoheptulose 7-phosphate isomerase
VKQWISNYLRAQKAAHDSIPVDAVAELIGRLRLALQENRQIFVFGNGGSAANCLAFRHGSRKGRFGQNGQTLPGSLAQRQRELDDGPGQ